MTHPEYKKKLLQRQKTLINCTCGESVMKCNFKYHMSSKKHIAKANNHLILKHKRKKINNVKKSLILQIEIIVND